jgi:hypothetical protein
MHKARPWHREAAIRYCGFGDRVESKTVHISVRCYEKFTVLGESSPYLFVVRICENGPVGDGVPGAVEKEPRNLVIQEVYCKKFTPRAKGDSVNSLQGISRNDAVGNEITLRIDFETRDTPKAL